MKRNGAKAKQPFPRGKVRTQGAAALAGNALLEFCITLPIIIAIVGLTIYISLGMLTKQQTLIEARHNVWRTTGWPSMNLAANWDPADGVNPNSNMPRGLGNGLNELAVYIKPQILEQSDNTEALAYFERVWGNLPGRHEWHEKNYYRTKAPLWNWLDRPVKAAHYRDSSTWTVWHINAWKICQENTLADFREAFHAELDNVPQYFQYAMDRIMRNLFDDRLNPQD